VAPILLDQPPQIGQQALAVRHRAAAQFLRRGHRFGQPGGQQLLAEKPADPRRLGGLEGEFVEGGGHGYCVRNSLLAGNFAGFLSPRTPETRGTQGSRPKSPVTSREFFAVIWPEFMTSREITAN